MRGTCKTTVYLFLIGIALSLFLTHPASAYIDPGTGSFILQVLIAGLVGALFALKLFWRNITEITSSLFSRGGKRRGDDG